MNKRKTTVNRRSGILKGMPPKKKKHPFIELLEWLSDQGCAVGNIADTTKKFRRSAISQQKLKVERGGYANLGFDIIHAIAKTAGISEQMIFDACLGRKFLRGREMQDERLKEIFRKYQMIDPPHRTKHIEDTITILAGIVESALDNQTGPEIVKAKIRRQRRPKPPPSQGD